MCIRDRSLPCGSETRVLYRHHVRKLDQFHMLPPENHSGKMVGHEDKHGGSPVEQYHARHWDISHHVRLPKIIFYSELEDGTRSRGGQIKCYKQLLKTNRKRWDLPPNDLKVLAVNRSEWQSCSRNAVQTIEAQWIQALEAKWSQRRQGTNRQLPTIHATCAVYPVLQRSVSMHIIAHTN